MGDELDFVELFMPEPTVDQPCDLPAEGGDLSSETLDSTSSYVGNKTDSEMTPEGCGALAYVDETNRAVGSPFSPREMVHRDCLPRREHRRLHLRRVTRIRLRRRTPDIGLGLFRHGANVLREIRGRMGWLQPQKGSWLKLRQLHREHRDRDRGRRGRERPRNDSKLGLWLHQQATLLRLLFHGLRLRPVPARRELGTERLRLPHVSLTYAFDTAITNDGVVLVAHLRNDSWGGSAEEVYEGYVHVTTLDAQDGVRHTTRLATRRRRGARHGPLHEGRRERSLAVAAGLDGSIHVSYLGPDGDSTRRAARHLATPRGHGTQRTSASQSANRSQG